MADENIAIELTDNCQTDDQWFAMMNFGMPTLLNEPKLLMECITRRACRKQREVGIPSKCVADFAAEIIGCLGLRFEVSR